MPIVLLRQAFDEVASGGQRWRATRRHDDATTRQIPRQFAGQCRVFGYGPSQACRLSKEQQEKGRTGAGQRPDDSDETRAAGAPAFGRRRTSHRSRNHKQPPISELLAISGSVARPPRKARRQ
jgi:hypothetical protein